MRVEPLQTIENGEYGFVIKFSQLELLGEFSPQVFEQAMRLAAEEIARQFVAAHGQAVLASIRPEAVATMTMAEAGAKVNETLHKKLPDKIVEVVRQEREVYQRGVFGGLRRIR